MSSSSGRLPEQVGFQGQKVPDLRFHISSRHGLPVFALYLNPDTFFEIDPRAINEALTPARKKRADTPGAEPQSDFRPLRITSIQRGDEQDIIMVPDSSEGTVRFYIGHYHKPIKNHEGCNHVVTLSFGDIGGSLRQYARRAGKWLKANRRA